MGRAEHVPGVAGKLAYNPCLIRQQDRTYLAVRVESPQSYWRDEALWDPQVQFFERVGAQWVPARGAPVFPAAEDPFASWVLDKNGDPLLVFGVVSLDFRSGAPALATRFYAAPDIFRLDPASPFLEVPGMKDVRLLQRADGVAACGRPQGGSAGRGRVSFTLVDSWLDLTPGVIRDGHVFHDQVAEDTKIGANELYDLGDQIGVLGHVAIGDEGGPQSYAAAWWTIDPVRLAASRPEVVAVREDFPAAPAKWPYLADVVFPGSLEAVNGGMARLYCGLSDASVGSIVIRPSFQLPR
ncbi:MAG TPA: DUF1861 family protein [Micromonosporaceae bacterium]|nr:DUF1861 family protein [Micromonosporaceae bacterium]